MPRNFLKEPCEKLAAATPPESRCSAEFSNLKVPKHVQKVRVLGNSRLSCIQQKGTVGRVKPLEPREGEPRQPNQA